MTTYGHCAGRLCVQWPCTLVVCSKAQQLQVDPVDQRFIAIGL